MMVVECRSCCRCDCGCGCGCGEEMLRDDKEGLVRVWEVSQAGGFV